MDVPTPFWLVPIIVPPLCFLVFISFVAWMSQPGKNYLTLEEEEALEEVALFLEQAGKRNRKNIPNERSRRCAKAIRSVLERLGG